MPLAHRQNSVRSKQKKDGQVRFHLAILGGRQGCALGFGPGSLEFTYEP